MKPAARIVDVPANEEHELTFLLSEVHQTGKLTRYANTRITIGKGEECDINLAFGGRYSEDTTKEALKRVSREHGTLQASRGHIKYTDLSSNGTAILRQGHAYVLKKNYSWYLRNGDVLYLGVWNTSNLDAGYGPLRFVEKTTAFKRIIGFLFGIE